MNEECRSGQEAVTSRKHRLVASSRQLFSSFFHNSCFLPTVGLFFSLLSPAIGVLFCACGWLALAVRAARGWGERKCGDGLMFSAVCHNTYEEEDSALVEKQAPHQPDGPSTRWTAQHIMAAGMWEGEYVGRRNLYIYI